MNEEQAIKEWIEEKRKDILARLEKQGILKDQISRLINDWMTGVQSYRTTMKDWHLTHADMLVLSDLKQCHKWLYLECFCDDFKNDN